jgi:hypothetical protein
MKLVHCSQSFLIGSFITFVAMMLITGFVITGEFVSKTSLKTKIVYIDGKTYTVEEQK